LSGTIHIVSAFIHNLVSNTNSMACNR